MKINIFDTDKKYSVIYADPPWRQSKGGKKKVRPNTSGKGLDYEVLYLEDIENYVTKRTCLWLKGLKPLQGNSLDKPNNAELFGKHPNGKARCWEEMVKGNRATVRSKTFPGIAKAMAEQWG